MRLIDADALPLILVPSYMSEDIRGVLELIQKAIREAPTIDAEPVRHGKWIGKPICGYSSVRCSVCGDVFLENKGTWKYCPSCGARMEW